MTLRLLPLFFFLPLMGIAILRPEFYRALVLLPLALVIGCIAGLMYLKIPASTRQRIWSSLTRVSRNPGGFFIAGLWTLLLSLLPTIQRGHFPIPYSQDEHSYLLAADTFAHGRLANPTPAGWEHFETHHVTMVPSYHSKYQPGMGLILALGQVFGHPYFGVLLSLVFASSALFWMMRIWLPVRWSLAGTLLACLPVVLSWGDRYLVAGPLTMGAGALLLAHFRLIVARGPRLIDGLLIGLSVVIFFWTRPFEGAVVCACVLVALLIHLVRKHRVRALLWPLLPGTLAVVVPALLFQAKYNQACIGDPWTLPYLEHENQYGLAPLFLVQQPREEPEYRHTIMKQFHKNMLGLYHDQRRWENWFTGVLPYKFGMAWVYFFFFLWVFPLATLPELWRNHWTRMALVTWCALLVALQGVTWFLHHYAAPAGAAWAIVVMMSLRYVRLWKFRGVHAGRMLVVVAVGSLLSFSVLDPFATNLGSEKTWTAQRARVIGRIAAQPGKHLLFVEYGPSHNPGMEWVYNQADLANQTVILARSMGPVRDKALLDLYPDRTAWSITIDHRSDPAPVRIEK